MSDSPTGYDARTDDPGSRIGPAVLNPGSGPIAGASEGNADANMTQFARDVTSEAEADQDVTWRPSPDKHNDDGRWTYDLLGNGRITEVEMPGLPLESVRYLGLEYGQNIWHYPRLYVDGSSWVWKYAVNAAVRDLFEDEEEDE